MLQRTDLRTCRQSARSELTINMPTEMLHDADDEKLPDEHEELGEEQEGMRVYADCNERYEEVDGIETVVSVVLVVGAVRCA